VQKWHLLYNTSDISETKQSRAKVTTYRYDLGTAALATINGPYCLSLAPRKSFDILALYKSDYYYYYYYRSTRAVTYGQRHMELGALLMSPIAYGGTGHYIHQCM